MPNNTLTTRLAAVIGFSIQGSNTAFAPFSFNSAATATIPAGALLVSGVTISPVITRDAIARVRFRAPLASTNAATVYYGTPTRQTIPLLVTTTNGQFEHTNLDNYRFKGTNADVVEMDLFI